MDPTAQPNPDSSLDEIKLLRDKVANTEMPDELREKATVMLNRLTLSLRYGAVLSNFDSISNYIEWITSLPWKKEVPDNLDIVHATDVLERNHYGLKEIKDRILEYLSVMKLNRERMDKNPAGDNFHPMRAPILFFVGLVGTGKTTIAKSISEAMGRPFLRIPFGGMGSALDLRGQSRVLPDAEAGLVMKGLRRAQVKNPVILLDELDRVSEQSRADIMGVLVELLDPEQNVAFSDHFIDFPFDLSEVLFIATANNTNNISTAVMDRLEPIQMPSYSDEEKIIIGKSYVFPKIRKEAGLDATILTVDDKVWPSIVRPLGFDSGIRTLERTINGICRKVARKMVEGKGTSFHITEDNVKQFLPTW